MFCKTRSRGLALWIAIAAAITAASMSAGRHHAQKQPLPRAAAPAMTER